MRAAILIFALLLALAAAFGGYIERRGFTTRGEASALEAYLAGAVRDASIPKAYRRMPNAVDCTDAVRAQARAHWADHCATCHANNGSGDTMLGRTMYPKPPDMRLDPTQRQSDGALYYTIKNGIRMSGMPAFGEAGDGDADSWKLVCFVRHLPRMTEQEERQMRALNPKTPDDIEEQRQEDEFLNGGSPADQPQHHHH